MFFKCGYGSLKVKAPGFRRALLLIPSFLKEGYRRGVDGRNRGIYISRMYYGNHCEEKTLENQLLVACIISITILFIVYSTKYRKKVLTGEIGEALKKINEET